MLKTLAAVAVAVVALELAPVGHADVGNPNCGPPPARPSPSVVTYLCDEKDYLHLLAEDKVTVRDPVAVVKAGYAVCTFTGPADQENNRDTGKDEDRATAALAASGVVASGDAQQVVSAAVIDLC